MSAVEDLMSKAFAPELRRDSRSPEYKAGVRAVLEYRIEGKTIVCPYAPGTAQSDAFYAGTVEGHHIWREQSEAGGAA